MRVNEPYKNKAGKIKATCTWYTVLFSSACKTACTVCVIRGRYTLLMLGTLINRNLAARPSVVVRLTCSVIHRFSTMNFLIRLCSHTDHQKRKSTRRAIVGLFLRLYHEWYFVGFSEEPCGSENLSRKIDMRVQTTMRNQFILS